MLPRKLRSHPNVELLCNFLGSPFHLLLKRRILWQYLPYSTRRHWIFWWGMLSQVFALVIGDERHQFVVIVFFIKAHVLLLYSKMHFTKTLYILSFVATFIFLSFQSFFSMLRNVVSWSFLLCMSSLFPKKVLDIFKQNMKHDSEQWLIE